ncbi:putative F-box protein At1g44080 [Carex rostrata]
MRWSDLPSKLVIMIAGNLTEVTDQLRFCSVCSNWQSSFHSHSLQLPQQLPWLVRLCQWPRPPYYRISNINPFTATLIGLPCFDPCSPLFYGKVYSLVWDRCDSVVVAGFRRGSGMFYCWLGETTWASVESQCSTANSITFYEGRFYILDLDTCKSIVLDGKTLDQITVINTAYPWILKYAGLFTWNCYCANLNDELVEWIEVNDIGDRALFVDNLHCFSVKVGDNCLVKKNCIYSVERTTNSDPRNLSWAYSIFIFDMGNRKREHLEGALSKFCAASLCGAVSLFSWVLPSLN